MASSSVNRQRHPLSRSYGVILQSSLTSVLPSALDFSSRLPVSVLVRSPKLQPLEAFLGRASDNFVQRIGTRSRPLAYEGGFTYPSPPDSPRTFLNRPITIYAPSLHRSTWVAQEC